MTALLPGTFFIGREELKAGIAQALRHPRSVGALLVGGPGVGKTALLQHCLRGEAGFHIVHVRGSASSQDLPYRALSFLLSELEPETLAHPVMVLQALTGVLHQHAEGKPLIIAVDNAEHLDPFSSALISQLVLSDTVRVVLAVKDFARADSAFMAMWCDGSLRRFDVPPLSFDESVRFIEAELGAPASREAAEALWSLSGGNPRSLRAAVHGLVRRHLLVRNNSFWVLLPGRLVLGRELTEAASPLLTASRPRRRIVQLIALAGYLPWAMLLEHFDAEDLDALQECSLIEVDHGPSPVARCSSTAMADAIAETVPAEEACALYRQFCGFEGARAVLDDEPARHAFWLLRSGMPLPDGVAVAGARASNHRGRYACAALIAAQGLEQSFTPALALESVAAATGQGDYETADAAAASLLARAGSALAGAELIRLHLASAALSRRLGRDGAALGLDEAEAVLGGLAPTLAEGTLATLRGELLLARAEQASFDGNYRVNADMLAPIAAADDDGSNPEFRVRIQTLLCEAWAMTECQLEAMDLASSLARNLGGSGISSSATTAAARTIREVYRLVGAGSEGERVLEAAGVYADGVRAHRGTPGIIETGMAEAAQGRADAALAALLPAFNQLQVRDPEGQLPVAAAVIAYCYALGRDLEQAIAFLPLSEAGRGSPWKVRRAARHFQLLTSSVLEVKADAARDLTRLSAEDQERGASTWALISLCRAVRLGERAALDRLGTVAAKTQGPLARTCELYAKGLGSNDAELLVQAAELAAASSDAGFAADAAQAALRSAMGTRDKNALRQLQRRVRDILPEAAAWSSAGSGLDRLTAREREVAQLAAGGASNKAIAQRMFVSVRTVEGHLYQVYSKLNVCTRNELTELVPAETQP